MQPIKNKDIDKLKAEDCPFCGHDIEWDINKICQTESDWFYNGACVNEVCGRIFAIVPDGYQIEEA